MFKLFKGEYNNLIHRRQLLTAGIILGCILCVAALMILVLSSDEESTSAFSNDKSFQIEPTTIESGGNRVDIEEMWRYRMEDENKKLTNELSEIRQTLAQNQGAASQGGARDNYTKALEDKLQNLEDQLNVQSKDSGARGGQIFPEFDEYGGNSHQPPAPTIQKINLSLKPHSLEKDQQADSIKTVDNTIPAGAFAQAVLLSGVDASAAMNATGDPRPMLLRIIDPGNLPRRFKSDLQDCHCTASAYGDISSERVYARLEKLTCTERLTGEIIETQVAGYVAGPDGRAGIRGTVVAKDAAFLARSFIGGLFSGLSNIASPQRRQDIVNPFSAGNPKIDAPSKSELFQSGMAEGASNALDRLSKYYIERAEQLQPVVQVSAGQKVDLVFTEGTAVGDTGVKKAIAKVRDEARRRIAERASKEVRDLY